MTIVTQQPETGRSMVMFCGDIITFRLIVSKPLDGDAWIRTDLGNVSVARREIIDRVDRDEIRLNEAWHDIKMCRDVVMCKEGTLSSPCDLLSSPTTPNTTTFSITLPLIEPGHFHAKCFFLESGKSTPLWPDGENCTINVDSAGSCSSNIIYNAFVRQFGQTKWADTKDIDTKSDQDNINIIKMLDSQGYTVIPPSGKFRDLIKEVDFIFTELGCRILHLLPVHPTPTTYGRMGRYGSPYAALNFTEVDPALAEFDPSATPLEQFMELADAVHSHCGYIILDIAINHTGWASSIHERHPEWLARSEDGTIEVPGAWGVRWEDLTRLDYSKKELWQYMADIFLLWCKRRVDGFRCDAGYMIPVVAWEYIIARVRLEYPDTVFFLEGLGGGIDATCNLLDSANMNWAYSELFQNYDRYQIENYIQHAVDISDKYGLMVHFAETHDNPRLASISYKYAKMRTAVCALFSVCGSFGFAAGVEWFAKKKINVHESPSLNWGAERNQIDHISRLNQILREHPTFTQNTTLRMLHVEPPGLIHNCIALLRYHQPTESRLLILANLDFQNPQTIFWNHKECGTDATKFYNLLADKEVEININQGNGFLRLMPGEVLALEFTTLTTKYEKDKQAFLTSSCQTTCKMPLNVLSQKFKAKALKIISTFRGYGDITNWNSSIYSKIGGTRFDVADAARQLFKNPVEFCRSCNLKSNESRVVLWQWGKDNRRTVMVPPRFCLMLTGPSYFRADIRRSASKSDREITIGYKEFTIGYEEALPMENGEFFAIFMPLQESRLEMEKFSSDSQKFRDSTEGFASEYTLSVRLFRYNKSQESKTSLLYLDSPEAKSPYVFNTAFTRQEIMQDTSLKLLGFNRKGAMMRASAWWGRLESKYDALLAANINPEVPENRWILLSRYRIWAIYQGYSRELTLDCLEKFTFSYNNCALTATTNNEIKLLSPNSNISNSSGKWLFNVPTSEGSYFQIEITLEMVPYINCTVMRIHRRFAAELEQSNNDKEKKKELSPKVSIKSQLKENLLPNEKKIEIVVRPDVESRSFHDTVKAWTGPEHQWRASVQSSDNGFIFNPDGYSAAIDAGLGKSFNNDSSFNNNSSLNRRSLEVEISSGKFVYEPEWQYMVYHPLEAERGLDSHSDLFSPGYFLTKMQGNETVVITASTPLSVALSAKNDPKTTEEKGLQLADKDAGTIENAPIFVEELSFDDAIKKSLDAFIVERKHHKSVIAGYPWFLDWGRDSLIFCRALIEAGRFSDAKDILRLFGSFEYDGTLPNMICGNDAANRETSDAPLWFFAACRELAEHEGYEFLDEQINSTSEKNRTFREVLISMAHSFIKGTHTGMGVDPETNLFYSPSHFTWMDTNFPAGSPRQGYPVEIQALWYYALLFIDKIDTDKSAGWKQVALDVQKNVVKLFYREKDGFFSDCLHCNNRTSALNCVADDALRPNQLFLITLGLLDYETTDDKNLSEHHISINEQMSIKTVESCMELLIPGAIRSLADRDVSYPLYIYSNHTGGADNEYNSHQSRTLLNNPSHPYSGRYEGDEDTKRKPAYHNGTAWTWQFPVFCEAWAGVFAQKEHKKGILDGNDTPIGTARSWLASSIGLLRKGCAGYIPEILDGDAPHTSRGCDAQAWGSSELVRVWLKLQKSGEAVFK
ncbi:MAG: glycogen debranching enzyme N-terminal domain-containing protein [Desulfamplus sp.]|nr:glycogen debranching enzyme N-terminal domain-containing protein [Desulfamplus sp.]